MSRICIVSHPRSGSTSFIRALCKNSEIYSAYEMFHMNEDVVKEHLLHCLSKEQIQSIEDQALESGHSSLKEFYLQEPLKYLDKVDELADHENFIFKIFPHHIKGKENLHKVLSSCDAVIFLLRNTLHSCISNQVAVSVGTYANVDTSNVSINFDEFEFIRWHNHILDFFSEVEAALKDQNMPVLTLDYENIYLKTDINLSVKNILDELGLPAKNSDSEKGLLKKQDLRNLASEKVSNCEELKRFLEENHLTRLDDVAEPTPKAKLTV